MKKTIFALLTASLVWTAAPAAAELKGSIIFKDTAYGALTGAIIGGALTLFTEKPSEHLNYIMVGAGAGAIAGALFGVYESTALAQFEGGNLYLAVPTLRTTRSAQGFLASADLFRMPF
jgi:hypothetical protein